jgi:hypothetical protein
MHEIMNKDLIDNNRISITWRQSGQITTYHVTVEAFYVIVIYVLHTVQSDK